VAISSSVLGTLVSFHINGSTGPCIVLIQAGFFALALLWDQGRRGMGRFSSTSPAVDASAPHREARRAPGRTASP
jgi:hypothetical protein